jgi:uncharacterized repeat protein (TIGR03806 family)
MKMVYYIAVFSLLTVMSCKDKYTASNDEVIIPEFTFAETSKFQGKLSAYAVYVDDPVKLVPSNDYTLLELSSQLFTDHAHKQRLVKLPEGEQIKKQNDGSLDFPEGTVLVKTFFYYNDERDTSLGKRLIESRLLIKENNAWNIATYIWNNDQTDAELAINGSDLDLSWTDKTGSNLSTRYHIPSQNECMTCHQSNSVLSPIGPTLRNLNRTVNRFGKDVNQISYLQSLDILDRFHLDSIPQIVDYKNVDELESLRARAYLDMNCAHCHNPSGWDATKQRRFDFRYEIPLEQTGLLTKGEKVLRTMVNGKMPFIGTTMPDHKGIELVKAYINSL